MKRVLFIAHVESHILNFHLPFLKLFQDYGYETHVATNGKEPIPYCDVQHDICFERNPIHLNNLKAYKQLRKLLNTVDFNIIHCHTPVGSVLGRLACFYSKNRKSARVLYTAHGFHFYKGAPLLNWLIYYPIEKFLARITDCLITINEEDYQNSRKFRLRNNGLIYKINGVGIDIQAIDQTEVNIAEMRKELSLKMNDIVMITVGELNKNKNQAMILKAMHTIHDDRFKLLICGKGKSEQKLKRLITDLELQNQVFMLGYRTDIIKLLKISDIFVFPSLREGLSVAVLQAIASNKICYLSDIRGNRDLQAFSSNTFLFPVNDIHALSQLLLQYESIQVKPRMTAFNQFDIHNIIENIKEIYELN